MQRSSAASRQFYSAFYRWAILSARAGPCPATKRSVASKAGNKRERQPWTLGRRAQKAMNGSARGKASFGLNSLPTESNVRRPFETLQPWQFVVRFRTNTGMMVEYAVPDEGVRKAEEQFGRELERMVEGTSVRVEIRDAIAPESSPGPRLLSILLSGIDRDVAVAHEKLLAVPENGNAGHAVDAEESTNSSTEASSSTPSETEQVAHKLRTSLERSSDEYFPSKIQPFEFVLRSRSGGQTTVEMCIPEIKWQAMTERRIPELICKCYAVSLQHGSTALVESSTVSGTFEVRRYLTLDAGPDQLARTHLAFRGFRDMSAADIAAMNITDFEKASTARPQHALPLTVSNGPRSETLAKIMLAIPESIFDRVVPLTKSNINTITTARNINSLHLLMTTYHDKRYFKVVCPAVSTDQVLALIQKHVNDCSKKAQIPSQDVRNMIIDNDDSRVVPPAPTHHAYAYIPHYDKLVGAARAQSFFHEVSLCTDCHVLTSGRRGERDTWRLRGTPAQIDAASAQIKSWVQRHIVALRLHPASVNIVWKGRLESGDAPVSEQQSSNSRRSTNSEGNPKAVPAEATNPLTRRNPDEGTHFMTLGIPANKRRIRDHISAPLKKFPHDYGLHLSKVTTIPELTAWHLRAGERLQLEKAKDELQRLCNESSAKIRQPAFAVQVVEQGVGYPTVYIGDFPLQLRLYSAAMRILQRARPDPSVGLSPDDTYGSGTGQQEGVHMVVELPRASLACAVMFQNEEGILKRLVQNTGISDVCEIEGEAGKCRLKIRASTLEALQLARGCLQDIVRNASEREPIIKYELLVVEESEDHPRYDAPSTQHSPADSTSETAASQASVSHDVANSTSTDTSTMNTPTGAGAGNTGSSIFKDSLDAESEAQSSDQLYESLVNRLRDELRELSYPVAVVTAVVPGHKPMALPLEFYRGVTVSSFSTVALHPTPIISFNLKVPSRTWDAIAASQRVMVNVLGASPAGAAIADIFTRPYEQAHEPFLRLRELGVYVRPGLGGRSPPKLRFGNGVKINLDATLLADKTVNVGDHLVVFAQVHRCIAAGNGEVVPALAYSRQGYRTLGERVFPRDLREIADETAAVDSFQMDTDAVSQTLPGAAQRGSTKYVPDNVSPPPKSTASDDQVPAGDRSAEQGRAVNAWPEAEDPIRTISEDANDEYWELLARDPDDGNEVDRTPHAPEGSSESASGTPGESSGARDTSSALHSNGPETSDDDAMMSNSSAELPENTPSAPEATHSSLADESVPESAMPTERSDSPLQSWPSAADAESHAGPAITHESSQSESQPFQQRSTGKRPGTYAWGLQPSTSTGKTDKASTRSYSTSARAPSLPQGLLQTKVEDYLAPSAPYAPRHRHLIYAQRDARLASQRLEKALADGSLTAEESEALESTIARNERKVAKKLAINAAFDLRALLDRGKTAEIDPRRVQWMEGCIEKGLAVLLEEAKMVRSALEDGKLKREAFEKAKSIIAKEHEIMSTELMRLSGLMDEDEDVEVGDDVVDEVERGERGNSSGFDGFRGNL